MQDAEGEWLAAVAAAVVNRSDDGSSSVVIGLLGQVAADLQVRVDAFLDPAKHLEDIRLAVHDGPVVALAPPQREGKPVGVNRAVSDRGLASKRCRLDLAVFHAPQPACQGAAE